MLRAEEQGSVAHSANIGMREVVTSTRYLMSEVTVKVWEGEKLFYVGWPHLSPFPCFLKFVLGIDEPLHIKRRKVIKPGFIHSPWKSAYIRQHRIDTNWRRGELKSPKVSF